MSILGNIFTGSSPVLNSDINNAGAASGFATGVGEGDATAASTFYQDILSGDPTKEATALAPEISAARGQAAQQKKTSAEFGTRSGGTASANAAKDAGVTGDILNLEGGLKSGAASGAASLGTAEQGLGLQANQLQSQEEQQQLENQRSSILGGLINGGVSAGLGLATGGLSSLFSGGGGGGGNIQSNFQAPQLTSFGPNEGAPPPDLPFDWMGG